MLVKDRMSHPVITIHGDSPMFDALNLMRTERIRRLPVVDKRGKLIGIVSEGDLLQAGPSSATTFSVREVNSLLNKLEIKRIMTKSVITISEDTPIEEAARIMADNRIGGLPVIQENGVVGIITETDLFKIFLELLGGREAGVRLVAIAPDVPGELARLTKAISDIGGNIIALGTFHGESSDNRKITIKVKGVDSQVLQDAVEPLVERIIDIRTS